MEPQTSRRRRVPCAPLDIIPNAVFRRSPAGTACSSPRGFPGLAHRRSRTGHNRLSHVAESRCIACGATGDSSVFRSKHSVGHGFGISHGRPSVRAAVAPFACRAVQAARGFGSWRRQTDFLPETGVRLRPFPHRRLSFAGPADARTKGAAVFLEVQNLHSRKGSRSSGRDSRLGGAVVRTTGVQTSGRPTNTYMMR